MRVRSPRPVRKGSSVARLALQSGQNSLSNNLHDTRIADYTSTAETATDAEKAKVERKQSIDPQTAQQLEKSLGHYQEKNELIERNNLEGRYYVMSERAARGLT